LKTRNFLTLWPMPRRWTS